MDTQRELSIIKQSHKRPFLIERESLDGKTEKVYTTFDHALICLKLYELTKNQEYLKKGISFFKRTFIERNNQTRWNFSPAVTDIPPDADTTALSLMFFAVAEKHKLKIKKYFSAEKNLKQFEELETYQSGLRTFFNDKIVNEADPVDPIVNTAVAFLYIITNHKEEGLFSRIKQFLNNFLITDGLIKEKSRYYLGNTYLAERIAKLEFYEKGFLKENAKDKLRSFILDTTPVNILEASILSIGASHIQLKERVKELNKMIRNNRLYDGSRRSKNKG